MVKINKKNLEELNLKLKKLKEEIEDELSQFANKNEKIKNDWNTRYPNFNKSSGGEKGAEEEADEVEEYITLLPIEHSLELRLRDINIALKKIENGSYGKCERCGKDIKLERLKVSPEARLCSKCERKI